MGAGRAPGGLRRKQAWRPASIVWLCGCRPGPGDQVYKGVLSPGEFNAMVDELTSGPCLAFEVADKDGANPVEQVR